MVKKPKRLEHRRRQNAHVTTGRNPSDAGIVKYWLTHTGADAGEVEHEGVLAVAVSPNGELLATAGRDQLIRVWDMAKQTQLRTLRGHTDAVLDIKFARDGKRIVSGGLDSTVRLWDVDTGEELHRFESMRSERVDVAPEGPRVIVADGRSVLLLQLPP
jgi:WD40 repeat protein